jgi:hypothetical protein
MNITKSDEDRAREDEAADDEIHRLRADLARRTAERDRAREAVVMAFRAHTLGGPDPREIEAMLADEPEEK